MKFDYLTPFLNHKFIDFQILFKKSGATEPTTCPATTSVWRGCAGGCWAARRAAASQPSKPGAVTG